MGSCCIPDIALFSIDLCAVKEAKAKAAAPQCGVHTASERCRDGEEAKKEGKREEEAGVITGRRRKEEKQRNECLVYEFWNMSVN